ncbi:MAG: hypothetical protein J6P16_02655 [Eubacterium sp.]|nr:hypothetical protein [Eubacterium sp.]
MSGKECVVSRVDLFLKIKTKADQTVIGPWIFRIVPFVLIACLYLFMGDVLVYDDSRFSFLNDISNSICLPFLFVVSYNMYGLFQKWENDAMESMYCLIDVSIWAKMAKNYNKGKVFRRILGILGAVAFSFVFVMHASSQNTGWYVEVSTFAFTYYFTVLIIIWYISISCLFCILVGCYYVLKGLKHETLELFKNIDNESIDKINNIAKFLSCIVSFSTLWILAVIVIIYSDYSNAINYSVYMLFYSEPLSVLIVFFLICVGYCYVLIPCVEYYNVISFQKNNKICILEKELNNTGDLRVLRRIELINQVSGFVFKSTSSKMTFLVSIIPPILSLIIQVIKT